MKAAADAVAAADAESEMKAQAANSEALFIVDRIEGDFAVLFTEDGEHGFDLPVSLLPEGVSDGWHLRATFTRDVEAEQKKIAELTERRRRLAADDDGGDIEL